METVQIQKPKQIDFVDKDQRIFKVWGTVDIVDKQNERLQVRPYFDRIMPIIMKRGGVITFGHTDQQCAKILNYEIKENPETGSDGVLLTVHMFDDYDSDDRVWDGIKSGNLPAVSFKGAGVVDQFAGMDADKVVKVLEGYGFAIVDRPANPEALVTEVNYLAKSAVEKAKPIHCPDCNETFEDQNDWRTHSMRTGHGQVEKSTYKVVKLPDGSATLVEVQLPDGSYQIVNAKCEDYNDMNDEKKKKVDECLHKTEKDRLISEPSVNSKQDIIGGISMEENKTEVKTDFVTKEEYSTLSTKVEEIARGQDAILNAIKAMTPAAKKEDDEEVDEKKKKADDEEDEEKSLKKVEKSDKFKEVAKGLGTPTANTAPRPAAPDMRSEKSNDIMKWWEQFDHINVNDIATVTKSLDQREISARTSF